MIESVDTSEESEVGGAVACPAAGAASRREHRRVQTDLASGSSNHLIGVTIRLGHFATLIGSSRCFKPWTKTQYAGMVGHFGTVDAEVIEALALSWPAPWGSAPRLL
jgi:hypothetical protein